MTLVMILQYIEACDFSHVRLHTKIIPITDDSENYTMIIDRDYSKIGKVISEKYTLLVPKEIPSLE